MGLPRTGNRAILDYPVGTCDFLLSLSLAPPLIQRFDQLGCKSKGAQASLQEDVLLVGEWHSVKGARHDRFWHTA